MSQQAWDYIEGIKQDIIDRKVIVLFWEFEDLEELNETLTRSEKIEILRTFDQHTDRVIEVAREELKDIINNAISEREKTIV